MEEEDGSPEGKNHELPGEKNKEIKKTRERDLSVPLLFGNTYFVLYIQ